MNNHQQLTYFAGFDWAKDHHDVVVLDASGKIIDRVPLRSHPRRVEAMEREDRRPPRYGRRHRDEFRRGR